MRTSHHRGRARVVAPLLGAAFLAVALVVEFANSMPGDERALIELEAAIGTTFDDAMVAVGSATDPVPMIAASAAVVAVLVIRRRSPLVVAYLGIVVVAAVGNRVLKEIITRPRPDVRPHPSSVSRYSFPSGHAANTIALWMALLLITRGRRRRQALVVAGAVVVGLVGFSRLAIGVHYPSDILAGWLWVGAWAALVWPGPR